MPLSGRALRDYKSLACTVFRPLAWALAVAARTISETLELRASAKSPPQLQPASLAADRTAFATTNLFSAI
tara:strand:- start:1438 stop:1650 length:213 start_codon:yes stop_codon:yes gene_type:complete